MVTNDEILLKDRIRHLLNIKKVTLGVLAEGNETLRARYGRQINNEDTSVPYTTICKILTLFPDISADWLVMGDGSMRKNDANPTHHHHHVNTGSGSAVQVACQDCTISSETLPAADCIAALNAHIDTLKAQIATLEQDKLLLTYVIKSFTKS